MKKKFLSYKLFNLSLIICMALCLNSCRKNVDQEAVSSATNNNATKTTTFTNGFYIIISDFGTGGGVNWYSYGSDSIQQNVFAQQNPGQALGAETNFCTKFNGKLYLVSHFAPLVVADPNTLKETARLDSVPYFTRAFLGLTPSLGLISSYKGVYKINLNPLSLGEKVDVIKGAAASMLLSGNHIFILSEKRALTVLDKNTFNVVKTIGAKFGMYGNYSGPSESLIKTIDGNIWSAGNDSFLYKIDSATLLVTKIKLPFAGQSFSENGTLNDWNDGSLTASTTQNALFMIKRDYGIYGGNTIYKYVRGNPASLSKPFITLPEGYEFHSSAIRFSPNKQLVAIGFESDQLFGGQYSKLFFYDPVTGKLLRTVPYNYYYYPTLVVFN